MSNRNRSVSQSESRLPMGILLIAEAFVTGFDLILEFLLKDEEVRRNRTDRVQEPRVVFTAQLFLDLLRHGRLEGRPGDRILFAEMLPDGSARLVLASDALRDCARAVPPEAFWTVVVPKMSVERVLDAGVVAYVKDRIDLKIRHLAEETAIRERFHADRPRREEAPTQPKAPKAEVPRQERPAQPRVTVTDLAARLGVAVDPVRQAMAKASVNARKVDDSLPETVVDRVAAALARMSGEEPKAPTESPKDEVKTPEEAKTGPVVEVKRPTKKPRKERPSKPKAEKKPEPTPMASSSGSFSPKLGDLAGISEKLKKAGEPAPYQSVAETAPTEAAPAAPSTEEDSSGTNGIAVS